VEESGDNPVVDTREFRESVRLTFEFDETTVAVVRRQVVPMIAPPTPGTWPTPGDSGAWLDLYDVDGTRRFVRLLHDPYKTTAEHHWPDGVHELVDRTRGSGRFQAIVPVIPDVLRGRLWASPTPEDGRLVPATSELDFELPDGGGSAA
jgi:hypothetical protein